MRWQPVSTQPWCEPLHAATAHAHGDMALLYSSRAETQSGRYSFLLHTPTAHYRGNRWSALPALPPTSDGLPYAVGYLGYGMRNDAEPALARGTHSVIDLPDFWLTEYAHLLRFDHVEQQIESFVSSTLEGERHPASVAKQDAWGDHASSSPPPDRSALRLPLGGGVKVKTLTSNFTHASYQATIAETLEKIANGEFYQANITRKFYGEFESKPDYFSLFQKLCASSPAPYSAYIRHGDIAILSSSPECFLTMEADGTLLSRPIKGSARRSEDEAEDAAIAEALRSSSKNQAENLMIVDLMRHDLARVSAVGSVAVQEQSALHSYRTIHHLVSTIRAQKLPSTSVYDVARACFPPGSMTGAPKYAAMQWCSAAEKLERGVYSGALGWFGGGDTCDLSVVIRTLICDGTRFEFQVGGGIVADSTPDDEWRETLIKARGIAEALGVEETALEQL